MTRNPIARIDDYGVNACVKLDDIGSNETNRGVWVHNLKKLQTDDVHYNMVMYEQDESYRRKKWLKKLD